MSASRRGPAAPVSASRRGPAVVAAAAGLGLALVLLPASPASAHTVSGVRPTNYRSQIDTVDPPTPGLRVRLLDLGRKVELTNAGRDPVVVLGYQGEPYLRVGPDGVFENRRSPSVYLNRSQPSNVTTTVPAQADATAAPEWHRVSGGHTATWPDRRTRWEGPDPPSVVRSPGTAQVVVPRWHIALRRGGSDVAVTGRISWIPPPSPWPWLAAAAAGVAACVALGRSRRWRPLLAAALAALVAVSLVRGVSLDAASGGSAATIAVRVVGTGVIPVFAWVAGAWGIAALHRGRENGPTAAGMVGSVLAILALVDLLTLARSQVQPAVTASFSRLALAATIGLGVGLAAAAVVVIRREPATPPA